MSAFEDAVVAKGESVSYIGVGRWMLRVMPATPVRYVSTSLAITDASICWEGFEPLKKGFFGKAVESRPFLTQVLPAEAKCGSIIPEDDHFWLGLGNVTLEVAHGGARNEFARAVAALRLRDIHVGFDSWMSEHAYELGLASGRGVVEAD